MARFPAQLIHGALRARPRQTPSVHRLTVCAGSVSRNAYFYQYPVTERICILRVVELVILTRFLQEVTNGLADL